MELWLDGRHLFDYVATDDPAEDWEIVKQRCLDLGIELPEPAPRLEVQWHWASSFCLASDILTRERRREAFPGMLGAPQIVLLAFALELLLKTLAYKHGVVLSGHQLRCHLFDRLPQPALDQISNVLPEVSSDHEFGPITVEAVASCLSAWNSAFIDFRYRFEAPKAEWLDVGMARMAMEVLKAACAEGEPWASPPSPFRL